MSKPPFKSFIKNGITLSFILLIFSLFDGQEAYSLDTIRGTQNQLTISQDLDESGEIKLKIFFRKNDAGFSVSAGLERIVDGKKVSLSVPDSIISKIKVTLATKQIPLAELINKKSIHPDVLIKRSQKPLELKVTYAEQTLGQYQAKAPGTWPDSKVGNSLRISELNTKKIPTNILASDLKSPKSIKPFERDASGKVEKHPRALGAIDISKPETYTNAPKLPNPGDKPLHGVWIVDRQNNLVLASGLWKFTNDKGEIITLPDESVTEVDGKLVGTMTNADGTKTELTKLLGDVGHPSLAAIDETNVDLKAKLAGDFRIERGVDGKITMAINNVSGRYMADGKGELIGAKKELDEIAKRLSKIYNVDLSQIRVVNFSGPNIPLTRAERFPLKKPSKGVVLISGGTAGIGKELVKKYIEDGYQVATFGRDLVKIAHLQNEFPDPSVFKVEAVSLDNRFELSQFVQRVESELGPIKILINNAGVPGGFGSIGSASGEIIEKTIQTNLTGTINLTSIVVDRMEKTQTKGVIINMSSAASNGVRGGSIYSASKGGVNSFSASVAQEYKGQGIRVFAFNPGHVDTEMQAEIRKADPAKFPFQNKMAQLKETGALVNPQDTARQISYLTLHPDEFEVGKMIEYTAVAKKLSEEPILQAKINAVNKVIPQAAKDGAMAALTKKLMSVSEAMPAIYVNGTLISYNKSIEELLAGLESLPKAIAASSSEPVEVKFGEKVVMINKKPLGEGMIGAVYQIAGKNEVIKISKPNSVALVAMLDEGDIATAVQKVVQEESFSTKTLEVSSHGIFGIKEKATGVKLTDLLIEKGFIKFSPNESGSYRAELLKDDMLAALKTDPSMKQIAEEIEHMMELRKKYPLLISDLGPDNLFVSHSGEAPKINVKLSLVDIGLSGPSTRMKFDQAVGFKGYLEVAEGLVNRYLDTGVLVAPAPVINSQACLKAFSLLER